MNNRLVAVAAEPAVVVQPDLGELTTGILVVVIALMGLAVAWMLTSAWKTARPARTGSRAEPDDGGPHFWSEIGEELDRSRRFTHDFSLIRIGMPPADSRKSSRLADVEVVNSTLRSIDRAWAVDDAVLIMLPESSRMQAEATVERIRAHQQLDLAAAPIKIASFPVDGITSGALLAALKLRRVASEQQVAREPVLGDAGDNGAAEPQREQPQGELVR